MNIAVDNKSMCNLAVSLKLSGTTMTLVIEDAEERSAGGIILRSGHTVASPPVRGHLDSRAQASSDRPASRERDPSAKAQD
jgi:hypothetical protein